MKLSQYEVEVLQLMLQSKLGADVWNGFLENCRIVTFGFTGNGYFLTIKQRDCLFEKETIHNPVVIGKTANFDVGFLLFLEEDEIILECHGWSETSPPENIRDLNIEILVDNK